MCVCVCVCEGGGVGDLDVVCYDGDILEVEGSVNFVHHVERRGFVVM